MVQPKTFVGLDIGTTSVKVVVAEYANQRLNVVGVGSERSEGLSRGVVVDIDKTANAIQSAVRQAEQKSNVKIDKVVVGVPANQISIESCYGMIAVSSENREITDKDVNNVLSAAKVRAVPPEREIISVIPEEFIVDGFDGIQDPRGMIGVRLELYANMITGPKTIIHNIRRCVEKAGLAIADFVVQPLANAHAALTEDEKEFGTIVIDMGGGQTSVGVMHDKQLKFAYVDQEGGEYITKDISTVLNTTLINAERIKLEYGYAQAKNVSSDEYFPVEIIGKKEPARISEQYLAEVIEARLTQILETVKRALDSVEAFELPGGVVITGGSSALPGVIEMAEALFNKDIRFYIPDQVGMRNPAYTTVYGLVSYVASLPEIYHVAQGNSPVNAPRRESIAQQGYDEAVHNEEREGTPSNIRKERVDNTLSNTQENLPKYDYPEDEDYYYDDDEEEHSTSIVQKIKDMFGDLFS